MSSRRVINYLNFQYLKLFKFSGTNIKQYLISLHLGLKKHLITRKYLWVFEILYSSVMPMARHNGSALVSISYPTAVSVSTGMGLRLLTYLFIQSTSSKTYHKRNTVTNKATVWNKRSTQSNTNTIQYNCEWIATMTPPDTTPVLFSALITTPCQVLSRWTYPLPYYAFLLLIHYFTLWPSIPWPWPLTFDLWPWTFAMHRVWRDETLYQIWTQSTNPRQRYCYFDIWPNDLERRPTYCARLWDKFSRSLIFDNLSVIKL